MEPDSELDPVVASHGVNITDLQHRVRLLEKQVQTLWTPWWKRLWFWIDGWPLYRVVHASEKKRRPWDAYAARRRGVS